MIYRVEYFNGTAWKTASEHSVKADAERQASVFTSTGTLSAGQLRITEVQE